MHDNGETFWARKKALWAFWAALAALGRSSIGKTLSCMRLWLSLFFYNGQKIFKIFFFKAKLNPKYFFIVKKQRFS